MESAIIPFNKPHLTGKETDYICDAVSSGKISGNGKYTKKCQLFFEEKYGFKKCLLTTSCTDALEMVAILMKIEPGDEIILPSFTFVSTANAFILHGATLVFADSSADNPNLDTDQIESLITPKTKAIVVVHYAGVSCDMDAVMEISKRYNFLVVEDAAQSIDSYHNGKPLGGIGHFGTFSFHETKNVISGEGGMLVVNDDRFVERAEIIWEKGTNRAAFFRGETDKYEWVDVGSSFLPSEVIAAFLYAQLEQLEDIQSRREKIWKTYYENISELCLEKNIQLPNIPEYASNNANMFYLIMPNIEARRALIKRLTESNILAVFHYQALHKSKFFKNKADGRVLANSERFSDCIVRLPFYYSLSKEDQAFVIDTIKIALGSY